MSLNEEELSLLDLLSRFWWLMFLRGLIVSSYGILTFISPAHAVDASIALFGLYMFLFGLLTLIMGLRAHLLAWRISTFITPGIISIIAAASMFVLPGITILGVLGLGGIWSIIVGLVEIVLAIRLRKAFLHQITLLIAGAVSTFLGVSILVSPWKILLMDLWKIQITALVLGASLSLLSFGMRHIRD